MFEDINSKPPERVGHKAIGPKANVKAASCRPNKVVKLVLARSIRYRLGFLFLISSDASIREYRKMLIVNHSKGWDTKL